jgi:hypothetical protein
MPLIQHEKLRTILSTLDNVELTPPKQQQQQHADQSKLEQQHHVPLVPQLEEQQQQQHHPALPPPTQQQQILPPPTDSSSATWAERYKAMSWTSFMKKKVKSTSRSNNNNDSADNEHDNSKKEENDQIPRTTSASASASAALVCPSPLQDDSASSSVRFISQQQQQQQFSSSGSDSSSGIVSTNDRDVPPMIAVATRGASRRILRHHRPSVAAVVVTPPPSPVVGVVVVADNNSHDDDVANDDSCSSALKIEHANRKEKLRNLMADLQEANGGGGDDDFMRGCNHHHHLDKMTTTTRHDENALEILARLLVAKNDISKSSRQHVHDGVSIQKNIEELNRHKESLQAKLQTLQAESVQIDQDTQRILDWHELKALAQQTLFKTPPCRKKHHHPWYHSYSSEKKKKLRQDDLLESSNNNEASINETKKPIMTRKIRGDPQVIHHLINLVKQMDDGGDCTILSLVRNPANNKDAGSSTTRTVFHDDADDVGRVMMMTLTVQLLKNHSVEIGLQIINVGSGGAKATSTTTTGMNPHVHVRHAKLLTSTCLRGERNDQALVNPQSTTTANHHHQLPMLPTEKIVLEIPPLDDLVQVANNSKAILPPHQRDHDENVHRHSHGLQLLLQEIKSRIQTMQLRVHELSNIEKRCGHAILAKIGPTSTIATGTTGTNQQQSNSLARGAEGETTNISPSTTTEHGGSIRVASVNQRIVCILPEHHLRVVLLLSPDCPRRAGSVTLDQLSIVLPGASNTTTSTTPVGGDNVVNDETSTSSTTCATAACSRSSSGGACFWESNSLGENEQILHTMRTKLRERRQEFASPVEMIQALQRHVTEIKETVRRQRRRSNKERRKQQQDELVGASTRRGWTSSHLPKRRIFAT